MKRRNSFAPHLPKPALLPLLVLLALPPCTSQAGFLQEFYDDAGLQSSYTAPGLYASASMDTVTGGRFILKANREDFQPYYLQGPELKAGCGGIDVFLGAFSIPSKDEFVSFVRSIGTALPGLAFHAALQSLAPDLNEQISQFRDMLMRYANMLGDSCQVAENIMNARPNEWISSLGHKARNSLRSLGQAEDAHDADSLTRADGGKVVASAPTRTDTGGNIVEASELNLTWALLISGKGSQRLTQEKREVMMSLIGTRVFVKKGSGTSTTIEERNYPALDLLNAVLGEPGSDKIPTEAVVYKCDEKDKCLNPTRTIYSDVNLNNQIYKAMTNYRSSLVYRDVSRVTAVQSHCRRDDHARHDLLPAASQTGRTRRLTANDQLLRRHAPDLRSGRCLRGDPHRSRTAHRGRQERRIVLVRQIGQQSGDRVRPNACRPLRRPSSRASEP